MPRHYTNDKMFLQEMKKIVSNASCSKFIALHHFTTMSGLLILTFGVKHLLASKKELLTWRPQLSVHDPVSVITPSV
jgi:hypothetical protein